jgi:hypothetical protein
LIVKVKEPQSSEWPLLRPGQLIFTYFHFAASEELTRNVLSRGVTAIAYETLRGPKGDLPCLTPMSEVAGRMSIQEGAKYLERPQLGRGILLAGVPGVSPAHIAILGGGVVGKNAARIAAGFQANVVILDVNVDRLRYLEDIMPPNVHTVFSDRHNIREQLQLADLVIGAVLVEGARAPRLVTRDDLKLMKQGAVIIDVAVDQVGDVVRITLFLFQEGFVGRIVLDFDVVIGNDNGLLVTGVGVLQRHQLHIAGIAFGVIVRHGGAGGRAAQGHGLERGSAFGAHDGVAGHVEEFRATALALALHAEFGFRHWVKTSANGLDSRTCVELSARECCGYPPRLVGRASPVK